MYGILDKDAHGRKVTKRVIPEMLDFRQLWHVMKDGYLIYVPGDTDRVKVASLIPVSDLAAIDDDLREERIVPVTTTTAGMPADALGTDSSSSGTNGG